MKRTQYLERKSLFWSRLLGLLIAFAIVSVLVFGGAKNLMGELSAVYEALAASQSELAITQYDLATTENDLAATQQELEDQSVVLQQSVKALEYAGGHIKGLTAHREQLKSRLREAARGLAESSQMLKATDNARRTAESKLERYLQQPTLSVVVTTERQYMMSQRERFAASQVRMFVDSDAGTMFYDGQEMLHEVEKHVAYAERTQVVYTQTAPGQDVLECLNDANKRRRRSGRCGTIVAASAQAVQMQAYSYQSQYSSMQSLLWME